MKVLMLDNYDSFTYNIVQYLGELGADVTVVRNDEMPLADLVALVAAQGIERIVRAGQQMHGKTSVITTDQKGVFAGLPQQFTVNRFHSLVIDKTTLPACLTVTATSEDGEIQGVRHTTLAVEGVQFHPESILTEHGHAMLKNFLQAA